MLAGHLGIALAAKKLEPRAPLWMLVAAAFGLDLLWPVLLLTGLESVSVAPGNTAFTPLSFDHYPWSHSLVMTFVWATIVGLVIRASGGPPRVATTVRIVIISHWFLDVLTHRPDLPLWPAGPLYGLGLWNSVPATLWLEGSFYLFAVYSYAKTFPAKDMAGRIGYACLVSLVLLLWLGGPFAPPLPGSSAVALVSLALWIFPVWAWRLEAHRQAGSPDR